MVPGLRPVGDEVVDYDVAYSVGGFKGGDVGGVFGDFGFGEGFGGGEAGALLVVVAGGAEYEDSVDVKFMGFGEPCEGLHCASVFHAADSVGGFAVGLVFDPVAGPLVHEFAVPEGGSGEVVSAEDEGWAMRGGTGEGHAALGDLGVIGERGVLGEVEGPGDEVGVELVDVAVVAEAGSAGLLIGGGFAEGDVSGLPGGGNFASVDLVGEVAVYDVVGPDGGAEGTNFGVDASDSCDEEVGVGEVEAGVQAEGHDGGCGACGADSGEDAEDPGLGVEAEIVVTGGKREDGGEVLTLNPELVFAGDVAGVGTLLEHIDDDDLDLNGLRLGRREGAGSCEQEDG